MTKQIQIAIAAALLIAVSAPAFAESQRCMNKIGLCDKGEERSEPDRSAIRGADAPTSGEGEPDTSEPDTSEPTID
ncbi:MAG: hypothetical protein ACKVOI_06630 [Dongiaceae bacterium]